MATLEQQRIDRERAERQRIANAALQNGNTFSGTGGMFSMPSIMNMFGGGGGAPMETRPEVLQQMRNQVNNAPNEMPGMIFGYGPKFTDPSAYTEDSRINPDVLNSIYGTGTKEMPGIFQGNEGPVTEPSGFLDSLNAMSGDDIMSGLQGIQGLLDAVSPQETPLPAPSIARATPGLSLSANPYEDLYKRYGLLGR
jgi:hypothetical protein